MTEGFGQLTVGQLRESGVQPLVHRTDRFDNASRKSRAPTLTGCDRSFCLMDLLRLTLNKSPISMC